jgi:transcriptional regulator with XRE-family HTH domain
MDAIGETLRRERLRRGLNLEQVSARTKIGQYLLQAIEENQFDRLPGGLFSRSFLRQYAHLLDLDEDEVVASFRQQYEEPVLALAELQPKRTCSHLPLLPAFGWFVVAIFLSGGLYTVWENVRRSLPETSAATLHGAHVTSDSILPPAKSFQPLPELTPPEPRPPISSASGRIPSQPGVMGAMHVVFTATEPVWVSIQSDGTPVYSGMLEQQQNKELGASTKMTALVGNAGGLEVSLNGRTIGPIGHHGEVRVLELTPAGAHVIRRTSNNDASGPGDRP